MLKKIICIMLLMTVLIIPQTGCGEKEPVSRNSFHFNTYCTITIYDEMDENTASGIIFGAFQVCSQLEEKISKTTEGSDIWRINHAGGEPVAVSDETLEILKKALHYCELSGGCFDITVGRLTALWDFAEERKVPSAEDLKAACETVNYKNIVIDGNTVVLTNPDAEIDLGGIGKGCGADAAASYLKEQGIERAIIDLGGNVVVLGEKAPGTPWTVGIEKPFSDRKEIVGTLEAADQTVVTSGTYQRYFEEEGILYHHILDIKTGMPADPGLASVSIIGPLGTSGDCDALSTICFLLGEEAGQALIDSLDGFEAVFVK